MARPKTPKLPTLAELGSSPRPDARTVDPHEALEGDVVVWRWTCPHCDDTVTEPSTTPRSVVAADPACLECRREALNLELRDFLRAATKRTMPPGEAESTSTTEAVLAEQARKRCRHERKQARRRRRGY